MAGLSYRGDINSNDVIAKACLRQGSFVPGNRGKPTTGGRSASAARRAMLRVVPDGHCSAVHIKPYSGPTCQGHSAHENPDNHVYCYTKDVPTELVSAPGVGFGRRSFFDNDSRRVASATFPDGSNKPPASIAIHRLLEVGADTFPFGGESDEIVGACYCRGSSLFRLHGNRQGASQ